MAFGLRRELQSALLVLLQAGVSASHTLPQMRAPATAISTSAQGYGASDSDNVSWSPSVRELDPSRPQKAHAGSWLDFHPDSEQPSIGVDFEGIPGLLQQIRRLFSVSSLALGLRENKSAEVVCYTVLL